MKNALTSVLCFLCVFVFQKNRVGPLACGFVSCFSVNSPQTQRFWQLHDGAIDHTLNSDSKKKQVCQTQYRHSGGSAPCPSCGELKYHIICFPPSLGSCVCYE